MMELISSVPNHTLALGLIVALLVMPMLARLRRLLFIAAVIALVIHLS